MSASLRGVLSIAAGSAGGQLLALAAAPLLARLYRPTDFGTFAVVTALVAIIGTVAALRFEMAVPLPERERDAHALVVLGCVAACTTAVVGAVAVGVWGGRLAALFGQPALEHWLWMVPPAAAAMGVVLVLNQLAVRRRRFGVIGRRNLAQSAAIVTTQLAAGLAGLRPGGLALGLGAGQIASALVLLRGAGLWARQTRAGRRDLLRVSRRYRRFPLLLAPSGLLNVLGTQLPVLLVAAWYGSAVAGWLGMTQRIIAVPTALVASAVAQVYLAEMSRAVRESPGSARLIFVRATRKLVLVGAVSAMAVAVAAPTAFGLVFGAQWRTSGTYAQVMALFMATQFVATPLSQALVVFERHGWQLGWDVGRALLVSGAVCVVAVSGLPPLAAIWSLSVTGALAYAASWWMALRVVTAAARAAPDVPTGRELLASG
ncbi:lipopolysaccharide biosynthesis protein [Micromonospora sp. C31]|uniref:lipopolysaccharide biosynthesis protein n=1 Tax=Micromonospora sp. C31 TaxID=2824876 RepID=UPI001B39BCBD|nr:lipopolysaccharide biosynthesis protein [Micromonospora sp. C31]MBQ1075058.1 lipopolysaccharide biosynthesis protein [Micromonospora sp. C31]